MVQADAAIIDFRHRIFLLVLSMIETCPNGNIALLFHDVNDIGPFGVRIFRDDFDFLLQLSPQAVVFEILIAVAPEIEDARGFGGVVFRPELRILEMAVRMKGHGIVVFCHIGDVFRRTAIGEARFMEQGHGRRRIEAARPRIAAAFPLELVFQELARICRGFDENIVRNLPRVFMPPVMGGDFEARVDFGHFIDADLAAVEALVAPVIVFAMAPTAGLAFRLHEAGIQIERCLRVVFAEDFDQTDIRHDTVIPALNDFHFHR